MTVPSSTKPIRTTVDLPADLLARAQVLVEKGHIHSRNVLMTRALEELVSHLEQESIDARFTAITDDADYQALNLELAQEFGDSDWEALQLAESAQ